jgi:uncharacterized protein YcaQ
MSYKITLIEAKKFILVKQGLLGDYKYEGETGVYDFIEKSGCIQYDPVDVCGNNPQLVLQSRVKNFRKEMLYSLLYEKRTLIDYFDKNMAIMPTNDWAHLKRIIHRLTKHIEEAESHALVYDEVNKYLENNEYINSKDLPATKKIHWFWGNTSIANATLESMYFKGELIIHHRKNAIRYYAKPKKHISSDILNKTDFDDEIDYLTYRVLRRIKGVGLLWNKPSDAFLGIQGLTKETRNTIFKSLLEQGKILEVMVDGTSESFYLDSQDETLLIDVMKNKVYVKRMEFIAPLDNLIWDRKLIKVLFDFDYKWELYTPLPKRKYGYYVLPIIRGYDFIGRIDITANRKDKILNVNSIWLEKNIAITSDLLEDLNNCLNRFKEFNDCEMITYKENYLKENINDRTSD